MLRVSGANINKVLSVHKDSSFLQQPMHSIGSRLLNAPNEVIFKSILESFNCIGSFDFVQDAISVFVKVLGNYKVSSTNIPIAIQIVGDVRDALSLSKLEQFSLGSFIFILFSRFAPPLRNFYKNNYHNWNICIEQYYYQYYYYYYHLLITGFFLLHVSFFLVWFIKSLSRDTIYVVLRYLMLLPIKLILTIN